MDLFERNKIAPMAYTYIMKNIYDWYIADDAAKRAEITEKYKFSSQLPVGSGQKPLSHCVTAPLSWEPKNRCFKAVPEREGGIAKQ